MTIEQRFECSVVPVPGDDVAAILSVEVYVFTRHELVDVRGQQAIQRFTDKNEFEVRLQTILYFRRTETKQHSDVVMSYDIFSFFTII